MAIATKNAEVLSPTDESDVAEAIRSAHDARQPIFPAGGRTSLDFGGIIPPAGQQLDLTALSRVVDYTPRDMTIVVEAGIRMADLTATLAAEQQQLPIDVPRAAEATLGGVTATNWTGPRRLGHGTMRDYVIGIHAVDGRGVAFKGGGRVVKNVAGYDFCKLLTGSFGTLGVITQLALKVKPLSERSATVVATCHELAVAEAILERLVNLTATPTTIDLLVGSAWHQEALPGNDNRAATLVVRIEGTDDEVKWMAEHTQYEFWQGGASGAQLLSDSDADRLWSHQVEFADRGATTKHDEVSLVLKIAVPPSAVTATIADLRSHDPACTIQAHAASGIIIARFANFAATEVSSVLVGKLRPAAVARGGSLVVLASKLEGLTPHIIWAGRTDATVLMERIKRQFDPQNILNPGRFVY
ncbi:MAG: FAD-binding oxidoreductase [Pirellulales bacterium]